MEPPLSITYPQLPQPRGTSTWSKIPWRRGIFSSRKVEQWLCLLLTLTTEERCHQGPNVPECSHSAYSVRHQWPPFPFLQLQMEGQETWIPLSCLFSQVPWLEPKITVSGLKVTGAEISIYVGDGLACNTTGMTCRTKTCPGQVHFNFHHTRGHFCTLGVRVLILFRSFCFVSKLTVCGGLVHLKQWR